MKHWNVRRKNCGFTLIEMLVVVIIVGVVAAVGVPNLLGMIYKARIDDGVADIEGAIKEAKSQAIRYSQKCEIEIKTETIGGEETFVVEAPASAGTNNPRCLFEKRVLPTGVEVTDNPDSIKFSAKGNIGNPNDYDPTTPPSWTITVSHDNISTSKCVYVTGLFGDVQTGIVQSGACNTNL